jgi:hypothetical protein
MVHVRWPRLDLARYVMNDVYSIQWVGEKYISSFLQGLMMTEKQPAMNLLYFAQLHLHSVHVKCLLVVVVRNSLQWGPDQGWSWLV